MTNKMAKEQSAIWEFFSEDEDSKFAICKCEMKVPRGGSSTKSYTITNLIQHLSMKQVEIHKQYLERNHLKKLTKEHYNYYHSKQLRVEQRYGKLMIQEHKELPGKWEK